MKYATIMQNKMKALFIAFAAILLGVLFGYLSTTTSAIPYNGDDTPPSPVPAFNIYTGVPSEGDESDFFKGKVAGDTSASVNDVVSTCETGKQFQLRAYVHNGASQYNNGDGNGPSVAKDTKVKVALPSDEASKFVPKATISSSNASSISDTMSITCSDGKVVTISYVAGTAKQFTGAGGSVPISDSIVTTGAPIGTVTPNGDVWGCWEQRVYVTLIVVVTEVPPVLHPAVCDALLVTLLNNQVTVKEVKYTLNDATLNSITIAYGDGNTKQIQSVSELPVSNTYANPGTYTIIATLNTTFEGKTQNVTSKNCKKEVTFKPEAEVSKVCKISDVKKISREKYQITATAEVQNTTVQKYTFTTKNDKGAVVDTKEFATSNLSATYDFFQVNEGKYIVKAVIMTADGIADGKCETEITVDSEPKEPVYACENPKLVMNGRAATFTFTPVASNGAVYRDANVKFFANGAEVKSITTDTVNSDGKVVTSYTYAEDAVNVNVNAELRFTIGTGKDSYTKTAKCAGEAVLGATTTTPPTTTLPDTGAGSTIAIIFAATAAAGAYAHRAFTLKRQ